MLLPHFESMKDAAQTRILAVALAIATLAACVLALINLQREGGYEIPEDGVTWVEAAGGLRAQYVPSGSPGERAGVRTGDVLVAVNDHPVDRIASLTRQMFRSGIWAHANYSILRPVAHSSDLKECCAARDSGHPCPYRSLHQPGPAFHCAGLSVDQASMCSSGDGPRRNRRTSTSSVWSPSSCMRFKPTTQFDTFDWVIYWGNIAAGALQPALFLHFAVNFSDDYAEPSSSPPPPSSLFGSLSSGRLPDRAAVLGHPLLVRDRCAPSPVGSDLRWISGGLLRRSCDRLPHPLSQGRIGPRTSAAQVARARYSALPSLRSLWSTRSRPSSTFAIPSLLTKFAGLCSSSSFL